ncbi:L,D-transpeptidase family protein [Paracoccus sp. S-4012]|uniref:L,D-transpeptidase family protein n=1 Tax=Paracoccus sp. S-4012 TaxID=2665648 RepID=UPI0012AFCD87|nr:L,D-transpeptidase family protein [Paracoccus sp. S-4012]MRX49723.1 L,D-transpeptidase family protein [Paracoccus sp. S-4012]
MPCAVGRGGIVPGAAKREGDGATPTGAHRIEAVLYRPDRIASPCGWAWPLRAGDLWCDESGHPAYNRLVPAPLAASHERLWRADPLYDLILVLDWNRAPVRPGAGSAIFVHQWRRPGYPTAGCIALARADLHWIAARLSPGARLLVPVGSPRQQRARRLEGAV